MPKYKVTEGFALGGGRDANVGDVLTLNERQGRVYQAQGRVRPIGGPAVTAEHRRAPRDPNPDNREGAGDGDGGEDTNGDDDKAPDPKPEKAAAKKGGK